LAALVAANLIPLVGVFVFGWDARQIVLLYWAENLIVGGWAAARMLVAGGPKALPLVAFFCVHFGMFTLIHGQFVNLLTMPGGLMGGGSIDGGFLSPLRMLGEVPLLALAGLVISHGVSFVVNFLGRGEWRRTDAKTEMSRPYPRLVVLHVTIILSAFVLTLLEPVALFVALLVLLKTGLDLHAHRSAHRRRATRLPEGVELGQQPPGEG
jgi:hypothetical protein